MIRFFTLYAILGLLGVACQQDKPITEALLEERPNLETADRKLVLNQLNHRQLDDARINSIQYQEGSFQFDVSNFELGRPTSDSEQLPCPQVPQGQHIRFILNDGPAEIKTASNFVRHMPDGQHHFATFLTTSIGESIKSAQAARVGLVTIENGAIAKMENITQPMIFLNLPDTPIPQPTSGKGFLLDFYLVNAALGRDYSVKIAIENNETTINNWQPYIVNELSTGQHQLTLTLLDKNGKTVDVPNNPITRTITVV